MVNLESVEHPQQHLMKIYFLAFIVILVYSSLSIQRCDALTLGKYSVTMFPPFPRTMAFLVLGRQQWHRQPRLFFVSSSAPSLPERPTRSKFKQGREGGRRENGRGHCCARPTGRLQVGFGSLAVSVHRRKLPFPSRSGRGCPGRACRRRRHSRSSWGCA